MVSELASVSGETLWDVASDAPELLAALEANAGARAARERLGAALPVAPSAAAFDDGGFTRPEGHRRAFYATTAEGGVAAIKGTEVGCSDVSKVLDWLARNRFLSSAHSLLEWYPLREQKIPMALLRDEALEEARVAAAVQKAYFAHFGELAKIPLPLRVVAWSGADVDRFTSALTPLLSPRARECVARLAQGGLAAYAYYYPSLPTRVLHLVRTEGAPADAAWPAYRKRLQSRLGDPLGPVSSWIRTAARIMKLGWLPCDSSTDAVGNCLRPQNAVLDGGFVDVDSLMPLSEFRDDRHVGQAFLLSLCELSLTVATFATGGANHRPGRGVLSVLEGDFYPVNLVQPLVHSFVWRAVEQELSLEGNGLSCDPRFRAILRAASNDLMDGIACIT